MVTGTASIGATRGRVGVRVSRRSTRANLRHSLASRTAEQARVSADGNKGGACLHVVPGQPSIGRQHARRIAEPTDTADSLFDGSADVGVPWLPEQAHRRGQIGRAEEDTVHSVDVGNGLQRRQGLNRFGLHEQAKFFFSLPAIVGDTVPAGRARQRAANTTDALRG